MNNLQKDFLGIIKSGLTGEKYETTQNCSFNDIFRLATKHHLEALCFYGIKNSDIEFDEECLTELQNATFKSVMVSVNQDAGLTRILAEFENKGIYNMPLKGSVIKRLYPKSEMRYMSDMDILIKTEQRELFDSVMSSLGYTFDYESDHEIVWNKNPVSVELHKSLIPTYNTDFRAYYRDDWEYARPKDGYNYSCELGMDDLYIYNFTHFAKHYRDGGAGIKYLIDLYILEKSNCNLEYIKEEFKKLGLLEFYCNIKEMLSVWFDGNAATEKTDFLTDFIFLSGAYGDNDARKVAAIVRRPGDSAKKKILNKRLSIFFPPFSFMRDKYKAVKVFPPLLPFAWIWRAVAALITKRDFVMSRVESSKQMSAKSVDSYKEALEYVGLDYYTEE